MGLSVLTWSGTGRGRWLPALEPAVVFASIMLYIWWLRHTWPSAWIPILAFILISHRLHKERPGALGLRVANFRACLEELSPVLLFLTLSLLSAGMLLQTMRHISFDQGLMAFVGYYPWGLFQQYILNSYFVNRFTAVSPERYVPFLSAAIFAGAHLPNWFLMAVTFLGGYLCAKVYLRYRNLFFLGLAHAAIGFLLFLVVPDSISHHLNVGPSWFAH